MKYILYFIPVLLLMSCGSNNSTVSNKPQDLDSLLNVYPDSVPLLIERGNEMLDQYQYDKALADGAKAFRLQENNIDARFLYATALNNRQNRSVSDVMNAQKHFKYIVRKQPKNTKALVSLASTYSQQMDFDNSFKYINAALRIDPKYRDGYVLKGTNYLHMNVKDNVELAISSYETAIQQDPKFFEAYLMLGSLYQAKKDTLCLEYYTTAAQLQPQNMDVLYSLAYAYQEYKNINRAKSIYRKMINIDTTYSQALFQLGWIKQWMEKNPDLDSAIYFYSSTIETTPDYVEAWHNLGICYMNRNQEGDKERARQSFKKALKFNPNFALSREMMEKLK